MRRTYPTIPADRLGAVPIFRKAPEDDDEEEDEEPAHDDEEDDEEEGDDEGDGYSE
jgi:hypothetical protein